MVSKSYTHPSRNLQGMSVAYGTHGPNHNQPTLTVNTRSNWCQFVRPGEKDYVPTHKHKHKHTTFFFLKAKMNTYTQSIQQYPLLHLLEIEHWALFSLTDLYSSFRNAKFTQLVKDAHIKIQTVANCTCIS